VVRQSLRPTDSNDPPKGTLGGQLKIVTMTVEVIAVAPRDCVWAYDPAGSFVAKTVTEAAGAEVETAQK
jgi:hypothetical protein